MEIQIKMTLDTKTRTHTYIGMAKIKHLRISDVGGDELELLLLQSLWKTLWKYLY